MNKKSTINLFLLLTILSGIIYLFTPRGFVPGGESWGAWAAAKILIETGGLPSLSRNPLYATYLILFHWIDFPYSQLLEYLITHFFLLYALYRLVHKQLSSQKSIFIVIAFSAHLAVIEGGGTVMAVALFCLYMERMIQRSNKSNWDYFPSYLLAASLCHSAYIVFFIAHMAISGFVYAKNYKNSNSIQLNANIIIFFCLAIFLGYSIILKSSYEFSNHMMMDPKYSPIAFDSAINIGFFQIKTWELVKQSYDPSLLIYKDWYFEVPIFFGESKTIFELFQNNPKLFFNLFFVDWRNLIICPLYFLSFYYVFPYFNFISVILSIAAYIFYIRSLYILYHQAGLGFLVVLLFGLFSVVTALMLTWWQPRYLVTLFPIFVSLLAIGLARVNVKNSIVLFLFFLLVIVSSPFGSFDKKFEQMLLENYSGINNNSLYDKFINIVEKKYSRFRYQAKEILSGQHFLLGGTGPGNVLLDPVASTNIDKNSSIFTAENTFFIGFSNLASNNIYQVWSLPPYDDGGMAAQKILGQRDMLIISNDLMINVASVSTQEYLRYKLHIEPFIAKYGYLYEKIKVPEYGAVYIKK